MLKIREIAAEIAKHLFTNGAGQRADRLVMELPGGGNGGGWAENCLADQIAKCLLASINSLSFSHKVTGTIGFIESDSAFGPIRIFEKTWACGSLAGGFCNGFCHGEELAREWYLEHSAKIFKGD